VCSQHFSVKPCTSATTNTLIALKTTQPTLYLLSHTTTDTTSVTSTTTTPSCRRFPLYVKLCRARDFHSLAGRRHHVALRLMALVVLAQSQSATGTWCGFLVGPEHKQYDSYQNLPDLTDQSVIDRLLGLFHTALHLLFSLHSV
jgi:hypothetical protein